MILWKKNSQLINSPGSPRVCWPRASQARLSREICRRPRLTQVRRSRETDASVRDSLKPAGPPLSQAARRRHGSSSRITARVLFPGPVDPVHTPRPGVPCHVPWVMVFSFYLLCPQEHFNPPCLVLSCPWRLVWGRWLLSLWPRRPFAALWSGDHSSWRHWQLDTL